MNQSLTAFVNMRKRALTIGLLALGVGLLVLLISLGGGTSQKCEPDLILGGTTCENVVNGPNGGGLAFGGFLIGVGSLAINLWLISVFLIQTSKSIVEGLGGNIQVPNAENDAKPAE